MKKVFNWTVNVSLLFIAASALTYTIHYLIMTFYRSSTIL